MSRIKWIGVAIRIIQAVAMGVVLYIWMEVRL